MLPAEHELCKQFGMSWTPVTRAVSELAAEGMVLRRRRHGTFLRPFVDAHRFGGSALAVQAEMDVGGLWYRWSSRPARRPASSPRIARRAAARRTGLWG